MVLFIGIDLCADLCAGVCADVCVLALLYGRYQDQILLFGIQPEEFRRMTHSLRERPPGVAEA
ncbi:hypothetical protein HX747_25395 [Streptomyces sp. L06]|nr:hypothetical protein [Streptomyces sp. L06]